MPLKAAIFDLDGVIIETVAIYFKAWKRMFTDYGKVFTFDDYKKKVNGKASMQNRRAYYEYGIPGIILFTYYA